MTNNCNLFDLGDLACSQVNMLPVEQVSANTSSR